MFAMSDIKEKDKEETENTKVIAVACLTIYLFGVFFFFVVRHFVSEMESYNIGALLFSCSHLTSCLLNYI